MGPGRRPKQRKFLTLSIGSGARVAPADQGVRRVSFGIPRRFFFYVFLCYLLAVLGLQQVTLARLHRQTAEMSAEMQAARRRQQELRIENRDLRSDAYLEKTAREELGLTRPGEILFLPISQEEARQ